MKINKLSLGSGILIGIVIGVVIGLILPIALNPLLSYKTVKINNGIPQLITVGTKDYVIRFGISDNYYLDVESGDKDSYFHVYSGGTYEVLGIEIKVSEISGDSSTITLQYKPVS